MDAERAAKLLALGRAGIGAALLVAPGPLCRTWLGSVAGSPGTQVALRSLGARDLLLGAMAAHMVGRGPAGARATQANAMADLADLAATLGARRHLPARGVAGVGALAGGAAAAGIVLARALA